MRLYNVLTRSKEPFVPDGDLVTMYVCGITPYDTTHLGHSFTYASFDLLHRYLEYRGQEVRYVQNVTDIDDDILRKANEVGEDWKEIGDRWTAHFIRDMKALNILPPYRFPRATDVIAEMHDVIGALLERGYAYEANGSVYFEVDSYEKFGELSRIPRDDMLPVANERGNHPGDPNKRDPLDFVLWQATRPGEPAWDSAWGRGRPGWHIECSTMATEYLGDTIDIHGGGADLLFPHHECETAQAEGATDVPFVRFWMHTAMVRYQGEKMSKSLGNLVMVRDLLDEGWHPDALRLLMHRNHYRSPWTYDREDLEKAAALATLLRRAATVEGGDGPTLGSKGAKNTFETAMGDDLDSPTAVTALEHLGHEIVAAAAAGCEIAEAQQTLRQLAQVFGLYLDSEAPEPRVREGWEEHLLRFT